MLLVVLGLVGLTYYSVVVETLGPGMSSQDNKVKASATGVLAGVYSLIVFMVLWSYFATVLTDPGRVPDNWHPFVDDAVAEVELQRWMQFGDLLYDRTDPRRPRYCRKCRIWKPQRTHHCSVSQRCILKMDHYCIWVVNCIGLLNYKFFILFITYSWIGCVSSVFILLSSLIDYFADDDSDGSTVLFLSFVLNAALSVSLLLFLAMHIKLILSNCTSIEMYEKQRIDPWPYDRGHKSNINEVFGPSKWMWLLPFHTETERQRILESVLSPRLIVEGRSAMDTV